ncbi:ankyrin repeat domain-containing protein [Candidatus Berkiella aquae]|uniref:Ankyrin repeat domain-containing protein n=1 Tax=Candidatus Berkiella aquae TaxID=295108 RepID=A0A0Q9YIQ7_9GAMM|nr:ankyrin repeat domain-containing protein [Candidatus Berkiella aquae]MCS5710150.1 ankyrin repeat domain-containing protein [Candidatus Berkiella aquae]
MLNLGPLQEEIFLIALQDTNTSIAEIEMGLGLEQSLLFTAITQNFQNIIKALIARGENFNQRNVLGETIAHQVLKVGTKPALELLKTLVIQGHVDIKAQTDVFSNPFHYASQITDPELLTICFSIATSDLLVAQNQIGSSALSNAIARDNFNFLEIAIAQFPELIKLKQNQTGHLMLACDSLLHDIANSNAQGCYNVLKNKFTDQIWSALNQYRIEEALPIDVAVLKGHRALFQSFKGYRHGSGFPTLSWIAAQEAAKTNHPLPYPHLQDMIDDAQEDQAYQAELDNWQGEDQTAAEETYHIRHRRRISPSLAEDNATIIASPRRRSF